MNTHLDQQVPSHPASSAGRSTLSHSAEPIHDYEIVRRKSVDFRLQWSDTPRGYRCGICDQILHKGLHNARLHIHEHFETSHPFRCVVLNCRQEFVTEDNAKRHRRCQVKCFYCTLCGKSYKRPDYLKRDHRCGKRTE